MRTKLLPTKKSPTKAAKTAAPVAALDPEDQIPCGTRITVRHRDGLQAVKAEFGVTQAEVIRRLLDFYFAGQQITGLPVAPVGYSKVDE